MSVKIAAFESVEDKVVVMHGQQTLIDVDVLISVKELMI